MENYDNAKKSYGLKLSLKIIAIMCFLLFNGFLFAFTKFFLKNTDKISKNGNYNMALLILIVGDIFLILFAYVLPYYLFKMYPKLFYFDDGVIIGKNGDDKILYKDLDYFFIPNPLNPIEILAIWYKRNDKWKSLSGNGYPRPAFRPWQDDFVNVNYPIYMQKILGGETVEFIYHDPKNNKFNLKSVRKILEQSSKIEITKDYFKVDGKAYKWNEYDIIDKIGNVVVKNSQGKAVFKLPQKAYIHKVNLLESIVFALNSGIEGNK